MDKRDIAALAALVDRAGFKSVLAELAKLAPDKTDELYLLNNRDVADRLNVSPDTVMDMVNSDRFPAPRMIGRLKRWRLKDVRAWMEGGD